MHLLLIVSFTQMVLAAAILQHIPGTAFKYSSFSEMPLAMSYKAEHTKDLVACAATVLLLDNDQAPGINYCNGLCKVYSRKGNLKENVMKIFWRTDDVV